VICDSSKIDKAGCTGAPDLIVEILSPSNRKHDLIVKFDLYQQHGVREYWIVSPKSKMVTVYIMQEDGNYHQGTEYIQGEAIPVFIFNGYEIDTARIFKGC
jgi:Uma2 family endonuclease